MKIAIDTESSTSLCWKCKHLKRGFGERYCEIFSSNLDRKPEHAWFIDHCVINCIDFKQL